MCMKLFKTTRVLIVSVSVLSWMYGCTSSRLVDIWHDPAFQALPLSNMMVVAVMKDATKRRLWEDAFSGELIKHGVAVTTSYNLFLDAPPDSNQVLKTVEANNFDGILIILSLPSDTNSHYVEGYTTIEQKSRGISPPSRAIRYAYKNPATVQQDLHYVSYWKRYWTYYREIEHPGYFDTQTTDIRAIDVTTTGSGGRLIWSATSRTPDPNSVTDVQNGIVLMVTHELTRHKIISMKKQ